MYWKIAAKCEAVAVRHVAYGDPAAFAQRPCGSSGRHAVDFVRHSVALYVQSKILRRDVYRAARGGSCDTRHNPEKSMPSAANCNFLPVDISSCGRLLSVALWTIDSLSVRAHDDLLPDATAFAQISKYFYCHKIPTCFNPWAVVTLARQSKCLGLGCRLRPQFFVKFSVAVKTAGD